METGTTRRELVKRGVGAAVAASGAIGAASVAAAHAQSESQALVHALQIEQLAVIAYRRVLATHVVTAAVRTQLRLLLGQELQHVRTLERSLAQIGARVTERPPSIRSAQDELTKHGIHWTLTHLESQHDCLKLLVDVESLAENAYFQAVGNLRDPGLLRTSTEIMGCEAQHWTVLSGLLNRGDVMKAVPYPFVGGSP